MTPEHISKGRKRPSENAQRRCSLRGMIYDSTRLAMVSTVAHH